MQRPHLLSTDEAALHWRFARRKVRSRHHSFARSAHSPQLSFFRFTQELSSVHRRRRDRWTPVQARCGAFWWWRSATSRIIQPHCCCKPSTDAPTATYDGKLGCNWSNPDWLMVSANLSTSWLSGHHRRCHFGGYMRDFVIRAALSRFGEVASLKPVECFMRVPVVRMDR